MIEIGNYQNLEVKRFITFGAYIGESGDPDKSKDVLLPKKELPSKLNVGDCLRVFIYVDNNGRKIATLKNPKLVLGEIRNLQVVDTTKIGAFLDWGLDKDLFLPFKEQTQKVVKGMEYPVALYIDKSQRLCATMRLRDYLYSESPYKENDWVEGVIYGIHKEHGAYVAVDGKYEGLIKNDSLKGAYRVGDKITARVTKVKEDGKLDLDLRERAHKEIDTDAMLIEDVLQANNNFLPVNDHSEPQIIYETFHISKAAFKRALGRLLKKRRIRFSDGGIELIDRRKNGKR